MWRQVAQLDVLLMEAQWHSPLEGNLETGTKFEMYVCAVPPLNLFYFIYFCGVRPLGMLDLGSLRDQTHALHWKAES